jgi:hypothetical protein
MFSITVKNENDLSKALTQVANLAPQLPQRIYDVEIKLHKERRSLNANAYFHTLVHKIAEVMKIGNDECKIQLNLEYGSPLRIDDDTLFALKVPKGADVKSVVKYPKWVKETIDNGKVVDVYMVYKETHTLDVKEMARLIDGVVSEAQELGIDTRTPAEIAEMKSLWETERLK